MLLELSTNPFALPNQTDPAIIWASPFPHFEIWTRIILVGGIVHAQPVLLPEGTNNSRDQMMGWYDTTSPEKHDIFDDCSKCAGRSKSYFLFIEWGVWSTFSWSFRGSGTVL